ncbi:MAG: radical SAM protein [Ignavibacteriae bacterium]|nr:MAG: radical SAM protein [Ignavibacteriota bacterium]
MKVFGPIPSRRLGQSLGINNIPPKTCSYSCVYCQVGRTSRMLTERREFYKPEDILNEVAEKIVSTRKANEIIDYITFVPDGEPTLDLNLGQMIEMLKPYNIKIAVITNGSLLWKKDVQEDLFKADLVSIKIDSVLESVWRKINRPQHTLTLSKIIEGIDRFCQHFKGDLLTETMLVEDINDFDESLKETASLISWLDPTKAYLLIPTRPPAESWVKPPSNEAINNAFQIFDERLNKVELITGYEGNDFVYTGNFEDELLSTLSVHPMREEAIESFIEKSMAGWSILQKLLTEKKLVEVEYAGNKFYQRNFNERMISN